VRQAAEHTIASLCHFPGRKVFESQIEPASQHRVDFANMLRVSLARRKCGDLGLGVAQQELDKLERRITRSTKYSHPNHVHLYPIFSVSSARCRTAHCNHAEGRSLQPLSLPAKTDRVLMGFTKGFPAPPEMTNPSLDILFDSGPVLVVNKQSGLLTQAPSGIDSLEVRVKEFYRRREAKEGNIYLGLPHRLDRPVSGAIVFARHVRAAQRLATQFENRTVAKVYWAVVEGEIQEDEGTWLDHLHKRHGMAQAIVVPPDDPRGKLAILHYRVLARVSGNSWLEVQLETGRTHQIRVQAASRGHAVLGDTKYGAKQPFGEQFDDERLRAIALHARQLGFTHPMTSEPVNIIAPTPAVWQAIGLPRQC
jgi:23S rRNA pseudouridine1911/1915/1917 synthase